METSVHVGIAGFGKMGSAMAARLAETGAQVLVWNRDPDAPRKAGVEVAETARDLARRCEIVISSFFEDAALKAAFEGVDGLIAGGAGRLFIEMSTVLPRAPSRAAEFQGLARDQSPAHPAHRVGRVTAGGGLPRIARIWRRRLFHTLQNRTTQLFRFLRTSRARVELDGLGLVQIHRYIQVIQHKLAERGMGPGQRIEHIQLIPVIRGKRCREITVALRDRAGVAVSIALVGRVELLP